MKNKKEYFIDGPTGKIAVSEVGEGAPLLCLHGWLDNGASFWPLAEALPDFRWLCVDFPGHGRSAQRPPGSVYHFTDYVIDVLFVHQQLGLDKAHIIGHSMGAAVGVMFAAIFAEKTDKLVLLDGLGPVSGEDADGFEQLNKSISAAAEPKKPPRIYDSLNTLVDRRMAAGKINKQNAKLLLQRNTTKIDDNVIVHSDSRLKQPSPVYMSQTKVLSIIRAVNAQTLLVMADKGLAVNNKNTPERIAAFAKIETKTITGSHHAHMDDAQQVAREIKNFIRS